ncbi:Serine carboxypeptidase S28 domain containing protein [Naviculisporaceae sp. PSN 640]
MKAPTLLLAWATSALALLPAPNRLPVTDREFLGVPLTPAEVFQNLELLQDGELGALAGIPEYTLKMPVDHFRNSTDGPTYDHRYWVNDKFYNPKDPTAPIIFVDFAQKTVTSNRVALEMGALPNTEWRSAAVRLAEDMGGMIVGMEHRYYGKSLPAKLEHGVPVDGMEAYKYLTLGQSLNDVVYFAKNHFPQAKLNHSQHVQNLSPEESRRERHPDSRPWIWIGGGYAGFRGAAMRHAYPDVIQAVWASSAPVRFEPHATALDFVMYRALSYSCAEDISAAMKHLDQILTSSSQSNLTSSFTAEDVKLMAFMTGFSDVPAHPQSAFIAELFQTYSQGGDYQVLTQLWAPLVNRFRSQGATYLDNFCHELHSFNADAFLKYQNPYSKRVFPGESGETEFRQLPQDMQRYLRGISFLNGAPRHKDVGEAPSVTKYAAKGISEAHGRDTALAAFVFATWSMNKAQPQRQKPAKVHVTGTNEYRIGNDVYKVNSDLFSPADPVADLLAYSYQSYTQLGMIPAVDTRSGYSLGPANLIKNNRLHSILQRNNIHTVLKAQYDFPDEGNTLLQKGNFFLNDPEVKPPATTPNQFGSWDFNPSNTMFTIGEFSYLSPYALGSPDLVEATTDSRTNWTDALYSPSIPYCYEAPGKDPTGKYLKQSQYANERPIFGFWFEDTGTFDELWGKKVSYLKDGKKREQLEPEQHAMSYFTFRNALRGWLGCWKDQKAADSSPEY